MFSELSDKELNGVYQKLMQQKRDASKANDEITWKALYQIEQDLSKEMRERAISLKPQLLQGLLPDKGDEIKDK